jgi:hypothetical protein
MALSGKHSEDAGRADARATQPGSPDHRLKPTTGKAGHRPPAAVRGSRFAVRGSRFAVRGTYCFGQTVFFGGICRLIK